VTLIQQALPSKLFEAMRLGQPLDLWTAKQNIGASALLSRPLDVYRPTSPTLPQK
jgi:hypothetical protein